MTTEVLEDEHYRVEVGPHGEIRSLLVKEWQVEVIAEPRLAEGFRINLPLPGRLDHYLHSKDQRCELVRVSERRLEIRTDQLLSDLDTFAVRACFTIELSTDGCAFSASVDNDSSYPLAELWFPILGGLHGLGERAATRCITPGYTEARVVDVFGSPAPNALGRERPCHEFCYPGDIVMPWISIGNADTARALYVAELNRLQRRISLVLEQVPGLHGAMSGDNWPSDDELGGDPAGVVLSKVAYPHTRAGRFESGTTLLCAHAGDWHESAKIYRAWFLHHFPLRTSPSWLRREPAWFSSILYQPEDRVIATLEEYGSWLEDAIAIGVTTGELIGWDKGGIERDYPEYVPEERLGGWAGYRDLVRRVHGAGGRLLTFVNYQVLDSCTAWYRDDLHRFRRMDSFGQTENWMAWGYSTLKAATGADVRRHVPASVAVPGFRELIDGYLLRLVHEGADGFQIDKLCVAGQLDFNPGHRREPDLPMCEDLVQAVESAYRACREVNPDFALAAEAGSDRFVPFVDVFYRAATPSDISPLRYAFPEWTACIHVSSPFDFTSINAAMMLGAVLVVEPFNYTRPVSHRAFAPAARYLTECLRIRREYLERIFLADYLDDRQATVASTSESKTLAYRVHAHWRTGQRAIVVTNTGRQPVEYEYALPGATETGAMLVEPFATARGIPTCGQLILPGERFQLILE